MRNGDNIHIRTGRSYGGILHNSRNESQNAYNDAYYDTGTTFDRFGNRLNRTNLYNDQYQTREPNYRQQPYTRQGFVNRGVYREPVQNGYSDPEIDRRYAAHGYSAQEMAEAQRMETVKEFKYNSATLSGTYHNLDNPKEDVRNFPEGGQNEE